MNTKMSLFNRSIVFSIYGAEWNEGTTQLSVNESVKDKQEGGIEFKPESLNSIEIFDFSPDNEEVLYSPSFIFADAKITRVHSKVKDQQF